VIYKFVKVIPVTPVYEFKELSFFLIELDSFVVYLFLM
jgi:hypothetical protein